MFQIFVDVSVGTGSDNGDICVKIFFLVRKDINSTKLFQKNIFEMASKDVGKWVSTRAHNLCHDNSQLIVLVINCYHSASKNNCN